MSYLPDLLRDNAEVHGALKREIVSLTRGRNATYSAASAAVETSGNSGGHRASPQQEAA